MRNLEIPERTIFFWTANRKSDLSRPVQPESQPVMLRLREVGEKNPHDTRLANTSCCTTGSASVVEELGNRLFVAAATRGFRGVETRR
jgi:hypothetical protein